jgi:hypothetical protein
MATITQTTLTPNAALAFSGIFNHGATNQLTWSASDLNPESFVLQLTDQDITEINEALDAFKS